MTSRKKDFEWHKQELQRNEFDDDDDESNSDGNSNSQSAIVAI